jgi:molybdopterin molybdotransferase
MQEHCRTLPNGNVLFTHAGCPGDNIRRAGEDIERGSEVLPSGYRLRPQDIGLAASVGTPTLAVARRLRVAILSSGDELVNPGGSAGPGQIFNSNRYLLSALLETLGCLVVDMGCVADSRSKTLEALRLGARAADVLITSGGMAVGDEDHMRSAAAELGELSLWGIAMKPGKPLAFGRLRNADFFGLPGNPVALLVGFCLFVRPFLLRRMGVKDVAPETVSVRAAFELSRPCARRQYLRARLETRADGTRVAHLHRNQSSGVLSSTVWAHGLVIVPEQGVVVHGQALQFMSFSHLIS